MAVVDGLLSLGASACKLEKSAGRPMAWQGDGDRMTMATATVIGFLALGILGYQRSPQKSQGAHLPPMDLWEQCQQDQQQSLSCFRRCGQPCCCPYEERVAPPHRERTKDPRSSEEAKPLASIVCRDPQLPVPRSLPGQRRWPRLRPQHSISMGPRCCLRHSGGPQLFAALCAPAANLLESQCQCQRLAMGLFLESAP